MLINCTGSQLKIFNDIEARYVSIEMNHHAPRLYDLKHDVELQGGVKFISIPRRGFLDNLDVLLPRKEGVIYIVNEEVATAAGRKDFVYPYWFDYEDNDGILHYKGVAIN